MTIADFDAAGSGVHVTSQSSAWHALAEAAQIVRRQGRFTVQVAQTLPLEDAAEAHRTRRGGPPRGKIVLAP